MGFNLAPRQEGRGNSKAPRVEKFFTDAAPYNY